MKRIGAVLVLFCALCLLGPMPATAVTINTVPVGNAGNPSDWTGLGAVAHEYRVGTYEVTNDEYVEFLNTKDATGGNSLGLYNTSMTSDVRGGINFAAGNANGAKYSAKTDMGNKPVNYVSWYDSLRFANWLNNTPGSGDTETGAYTLLGGTPTPSNGVSITRNSGAKSFLTSENEWYKAAYYDPTPGAGGGDNYWLYPTASDSAPTIATATSVGEISNPGANVANHRYGAGWNSQFAGNVTTVGSAGPFSESFYGTSDQGGNVYEWTEALRQGAFRVLRGGSWGSFAEGLESTVRYLDDPSVEGDVVGFRVATVVPEPASLALLALGLPFLLGRNLRRFGSDATRGAWGPMTVLLYRGSLRRTEMRIP